MFSGGPVVRSGRDDARAAFVDTERYLRIHDAGEYRCDLTGAGDNLPPDAYGETCIPFTYAQRKWQPYFTVSGFLVNEPGVKQNVIVARRNERGLEHTSMVHT
jgi:hypothetical protein